MSAAPHPLRSTLLTTVAMLFLYGCEAAESQVTNSDLVTLLDEGNRLIISRGWSERELSTIVSKFASLYPEEPSAVFVANFDHYDSKTSILAFPQEMSPRIFKFLVNYIYYPHDFDFDDRNISAVGLVILDETFESSMSGIGAFYVPKQDQEFDEVYVHTEFSENFRISFTNDLWVPLENYTVPKIVDEFMSRVK